MNPAGTFRECSASTDDLPPRLAASCPPETFTSSEDSLHQLPLPAPYPMTAHESSPSQFSSQMSGSRIECVLEGEVEEVNGREGTLKGDMAHFHIERPERAGETNSDSGESERRRSADVDTLVDEEEQNTAHNGSNGITMVEEEYVTDKFGFIRTDLGVDSETRIDVKTLRRREQKWLQMMDNWRHFMDEKYDKVRDRCRKGIPPSLRGKAWKFLCGAQYQAEVSQNKYVFDFCVKQPGDPKWLDDIEKDLNRQFPDHEMFARTGKYGNGGKEDLFLLLKAWTVLHPEEGYCQGQAPIASVLLMHMPLRDAFYCFVQICHKYLPGYYSAGLEAVQVDGDILVQLLKEKSKISYRHLKKNCVDPVLYMIEWFMCCFCRTLPWATVVRVWDMFFCEGVKILFKVAIVLFRFGLGTSEQCKQYPDLHAIVMRLKNLPPQIMSEEFLVQKVIELDLNDGEMERMHHRALKCRQMKIKPK